MRTLVLYKSHRFVNRSIANLRQKRQAFQDLQVRLGHQIGRVRPVHRPV